MNNLSHIIAMQCEHSGRSSAHANLLDVFVGIGLAANVHCNHGGSNGSNYERGGSEWEKLAQFVFGADWYRNKGNGDLKNGNVGNGSNGDNAANEYGNGSNKELRTNKRSDECGWNAPFLDVVPYYPMAKKSKGRGIKDIHSGISSGLGENHKEDIDGSDEAIIIADEDKLWGNMLTSELKRQKQEDIDDMQKQIESSNGTKHKNNNNEKNNDGEQPLSKKVRLNPPEKNSKKEETNISTSAVTTHEKVDSKTYFPSFCPPLPPKHTYAGDTVDVIREGQNLPSQRFPEKDIHLSNTNYSIRQHLVKFSASSIKNKEESFKYKEAKVPFGAKRNAQQHRAAP